MTGLLVVLTALTSAAAVFVPPLWAVAGWLAGASLTMGTITGYLGGVTAAVSFLGGIKNIYNVHTAKTAEEVYQGNNNLKKDAANTATGLLAMAGAKSLPKPLNFAKIGNFKNTAIRTFKTGASLIKGGVRKIPRLVSSAFKKETWSDLYASFSKFSTDKIDNLVGEKKKNSLTKAEKNVIGFSEKEVKDLGDAKISSQYSGSTGKLDKEIPEKLKPLDVKTKTPSKNPDIEKEVPFTKNLPELKSTDLKIIDSEFDAPIKNLDEVGTPKDKQIAEGAKPPKRVKNKLTIESNPLQSKRKISNELYSKLRKKTPDGNARKTVNKNFKKGIPDEALPSLIVDKPFHADHIVSMDKITRMDGFEKLSEIDQLKLLNFEDNFVGLSEIANKSKGAKSFAEWTEYKKLNIKVSDEFRIRMILKENQLEIKIQQKIKELLKQINYD